MKVIILCLLLGTTLAAPGILEFGEKNLEKFIADPAEEATAEVAQVEQNYLDYEPRIFTIPEKVKCIQRCYNENMPGNPSGFGKCASKC